MKVCIGITTHNRCELLEKAIQSALEQDYEEKEVFVIDDASTDDTPKLRGHFPNVRWERFEESRGLRSARNRMMRETDADLFCSLDDDSWFVDNNGLRQGVELFKRQQRLGALGFEILDSENPRGKADRQARPANMFIGCGHLLRLSAAREVGFYREMPGEYGGEEKDLSISLLHCGYEVVRLDGVHVWHDKTFVTRNVFQQYCSAVCNDLSFAFVRSPAWLTVPIVLQKLANHLKFGVRFSLRRQCKMSEFDQQIRTESGRLVFARSAAAGIVQFAGNLPRLSQARRPVSLRVLQDFFRRGRLV